MYHIGLDPGFGNFKVALVTPQVRVGVVPSVVGVGETDLGLLSIGNLGRRRRKATPDRVTFDDVTYLAGENVARFARPIQRMDFLRLSEGPELRTLFYAAIYRLLGVGEHQADLIVGLPVEVMTDQQQARSTLRQLRSWLVDTHHFSVDDTPITLNVTDVKAMAQPAGTFFAWGLNSRGKWMRGNEALQAPVAVCDIGFNTLDLFSVRGGRVDRKFTDGDTMGIRRAAEWVARAVREQYEVQLSHHEADGFLRERRPRLSCAAGDIDLRPLTGQALDVAAGAIIGFVESRWGTGKQFRHLLFTGGGTKILQQALLRQYPHGVVLPDPVTANAVGLARYAMRVFGKG